MYNWLRPVLSGELCSCLAVHELTVLKAKAVETLEHYSTYIEFCVLKILGK